MVSDQRFPSLAWIRAFEAAARLGSFAKAAQELDTTSASVSYHVRRLEQQIGVPLFVRQANHVALTESGEIVAREAMNAFAALRASFIRAVDADEARLSLTTLPTIGTSWLTPKLGKFRAKHPEILLGLDVSAIAEDLTAGRFDAAIRNGHGRWPGLRTTELLPSIFMPLCAPALKDAAMGLSDPRRRLDVPLLGRPDWWELWYRARGLEGTVSPDRFGTQLAHEHLDVAAAVAGHGIAIGSPILFRSELDAGRLIPAHDFVASDGRAFWLAYPVARQASRKIAKFGEWLCDEAARDRAEARASYAAPRWYGPERCYGLLRGRRCGREDRPVAVGVPQQPLAVSLRQGRKASNLTLPMAYCRRPFAAGWSGDEGRPLPTAIRGSGDASSSRRRFQLSGCVDDGELHAQFEVRVAMRVGKSVPGFEARLVIGCVPAAREPRGVQPVECTHFEFNRSCNVDLRHPHRGKPRLADLTVERDRVGNLDADVIAAKIEGDDLRILPLVPKPLAAREVVFSRPREQASRSSWYAVCLVRLEDAQICDATRRQIA